jgi:hypothetical protein
VLDAEGRATAVWDHWNGEHTVVEAAERPAGSDWMEPTGLEPAVL